jgi:PadR family transcriptional regulator PadR
MPVNPAVDARNTQAQMRKGILEFCLLLVVSQGKTYANDILRELRTADLVVLEGTVYPILNRLKNAGLLAYDWVESPSGPPRKYYVLTDEGKAFLRQLVETWRVLDGSITSLLKKFN